MLTGHVEDKQTDVAFIAAPPSTYISISISYKHSISAQGSNPCPPVHVVIPFTSGAFYELWTPRVTACQSVYLSVCLPHPLSLRQGLCVCVSVSWSLSLTLPLSFSF